jgi:hypothetical protein
MLLVFVQDQYQHELLHRDVNHQEEEHQFQQENVYQNDKPVLYQFCVQVGNDEMLSKLIVEEIEQEPYNQSDYEYELYV